MWFCIVSILFIFWHIREENESSRQSFDNVIILQTRAGVLHVFILLNQQLVSFFRFLLFSLFCDFDAVVQHFRVSRDTMTQGWKYDELMLIFTHVNKKFSQPLQLTHEILVCEKNLTPFSKTLD